MSASFVAASNQYLSNAAAPIAAAPFTVALWLRMPTSGNYTIPWALTDTAAVANDFYIAKETGNTLSFNGDAGSFFSAIGSTAITSNAWVFVVCREIAANNHRIAILHATGLIEHVQSTTSITPAGIDAVQIGAIANPAAGSGIDGNIEHVCLWNIDIQGDGAQLQNSTLRTLARRGPVALRHVIKNLISYRALVSSLVSSSDRPQEIAVGGGKLRETWTNISGATIGLDCPFARGWLKPKVMSLPGLS